MKMKLKEEISRNKTLMGLNEENVPSKVSVSSDGTINFWDLERKSVFRYKLVATTKITKPMDVKVLSIDLEKGTIEYVNPQTEETETSQIKEKAKMEIANNYMNKMDIEDLDSFKEGAVNVTIKLQFIEVKPLNIK